MNCPHCGSKTDGNICRKCKTDVIIYNKIRSSSNMLYNKGLEKAKVNDFSTAIELLTKSVEFDKKNVTARNLLGLVYFEVGQIGYALKHWVISSSYEKDDNPATGYIKIIQRSGRTMERHNDVLRIYNQALLDLRKNSDDIAIIQLKKAIDINPKFVDAYNLLALCQINEKQYDKATSTVEKALKIDFNNTLALYYYSLLKPGASRVTTDVKKKPDPPKKRDSYERSPYIEKKRRSMFPFAEIVCFVLGAAFAATAVYFLVFVEEIEKKDDLIVKAEETNITLQEKYDEEIKGYLDQISLLNQKNIDLEQDNTTLQSEQERQDKLLKLQQIATLDQNGDYEEAALALSALNINELPEDSRTVYESLQNSIYPKLAQKYYDEGKDLFTAADYAEAKVTLENCLKYAKDESFVDDTYYYLGRIAEVDEDKETAKMYYEKLMEEFTNSNQYNNAKSRYNKIK